MAIFLGIDRKHASQSVDYECELAVVIGKPYHKVSCSETLDCVLGYTCAHDISAGDWQIRYGGSQWCLQCFSSMAIRFLSCKPLVPAVSRRVQRLAIRVWRAQSFLELRGRRVSRFRRR
ncbi:MAG: fumarylacetoacetate hydrolase family protein [Planctomycetota bacterium]|nr:fumarylacetoacetate hydrolase family protein [Planctomycetota bacterium]